MSLDNLEAAAKMPAYGSTTTSTTEETDRLLRHNNFQLNKSSHSNISDNSNTSMKLPSLRKIAMELSLYVNIFITFTKLVAYIRTMSLSVLAALVDSVLDVVSQLVLNYTERNSSLHRSSAFYPAGASRLEPIGVLTCAALMGMASFEVLKQGVESLLSPSSLDPTTALQNFWSLLAIVVTKLALYALCQRAAWLRVTSGGDTVTTATVQDVLTDPTMEALALDHWNDTLSNLVAAIALVCAWKSPNLWWLDPIGAILISLYIIWSWYHTGKEQIEQLTGKSAPKELIEELLELANTFDDRIQMVDVCRAYHFGPKFLVELEVVLPKETFLFESHDLGMELQYEIESREEVERCFVHIDYETRPYDEHVVSKVPELREKYRPNRFGSSRSL